MTSNNSRLLCKNRRWIGEVPKCKLRQSPNELCAALSCEQVCKESDGQAVCSCFEGFLPDGRSCLGNKAIENPGEQWYLVFFSLQTWTSASDRTAAASTSAKIHLDRIGASARKEWNREKTNTRVSVGKFCNRKGNACFDRKLQGEGSSWKRRLVKWKWRELFSSQSSGKGLCFYKLLKFMCGSLSVLGSILGQLQRFFFWV